MQVRYAPHFSLVLRGLTCMFPAVLEQKLVLWEEQEVENQPQRKHFPDSLNLLLDKY